MSLHLYKPLGSNDESVRLSTAHTLTTELTTLLTTERTPQSKKDVDYALSRLTKGLSSGSNSSRPGFAIVLTEVHPLPFPLTLTLFPHFHSLAL
jgi:DNA polymerase phi